MRFFWLLGLLVLLALTNASPVQGQETVDEVSDDDVNRVARELYCPICENTPLDVCETQACEDWRQLIRDKLEVGQSDAQIIAYFAEIYGERARATPTTSGLSLVIWIAPLIGAVVGVAVVARLMRRWLARGAAIQVDDVAQTELAASEDGTDRSEIDDYIARLEKEVRDSS